MMMTINNLIVFFEQARQNYELLLGDVPEET